MTFTSGQHSRAGVILQKERGKTVKENGACVKRWLFNCAQG